VPLGAREPANESPIIAFQTPHGWWLQATVWPTVRADVASDELSKHLLRDGIKRDMDAAWDERPQPISCACARRLYGARKRPAIVGGASPGENQREAENEQQRDYVEAEGVLPFL